MAKNEREPTLVEIHEKDLLSSGIDPDWVLDVQICETLFKKECEAELGLNLPRGCNSGLAFYYIDEENAVIWTRIKPEKPVDFGDGKRPAKYLSPKNTKNHLYFPPVHKKVPHNIWAVIKDHKVPLVITEGEKKTLKANLEGVPCIGLAGVWSWKTKNEDGESIPLPDLDLVEWQRRKVFVCFDFDAPRKFEVQQAAYALKKELTKRGATVREIKLPEGDDEKIGLDDYLLDHTKEDFWKLPKDYIPAPVAKLPPRAIREHEDIRAVEIVPRGGPYSTEPRTMFEGITSALVEKGEYYMYGGNVVRIKPEANPLNQVSLLTARTMPGIVEDTLVIHKFAYDNKSGLTVPTSYTLPVPRECEDYLRTEHPQESLSPIELITKTPIFDEKTLELVNSLGYHRQTKIYNLGEKEIISRQKHRRSRKVLGGILSEVLWFSEIDRINYYGVLIDLLMNRQKHGGRPMVVITTPKEDSRVGKTTLADLISIVKDNHPVVPLFVDFNNPSEFAKDVTVRLYHSPDDNTLVLDNLREDSMPRGKKVQRRKGINLPFLEMMLSAPRISRRIITTKEMLDRPNNLHVIMTINQGLLGGNLKPRTMAINLSLGDMSPEERMRSLKEKNIQQKMINSRWEIIQELVEMVENFKEALEAGEERPSDLAIHPMCPDWAEPLDWILRVNGMEGFMSNLEESLTTMEEDKDILQGIFDDHYGELKKRGLISAGEFLKVVEDGVEPLFADDGSLGPISEHLFAEGKEKALWSYKVRRFSAWLLNNANKLVFSQGKTYKILVRQYDSSAPNTYTVRLVGDLGANVRVPRVRG